MLRKTSGILWGLAFIIVGALMIGDNLDLIRFNLGEFIGTWWPLALIIIGIGLMADRGSGKK
jgi:hypothetical protein